MTVLVTGGTGFAGSHLVRRLLERGETVRVLDNQPGLFHDILRDLGAEITIASVTDEVAVRRCVEGCEPGTRIVCRACADFGVRKLIYCSTCGVHGNVQGTSATEDAPITPADYYQRTKYDGEVVVQEFVQNGLAAGLKQTGEWYRHWGYLAGSLAGTVAPPEPLNAPLALV